MKDLKKNLSYWLNLSDFNKYLFPYLSPTTKGTQYWQPQPSGELTDRQIGRILLQVHQVVDKIQRTNLKSKKISFLDIGTGNGFIPRLIPYFINVKNSHGCDPFLDGEHQTSFQKHDRDYEFKKILKYLETISSDKNILEFESYCANSSHEHFYSKPPPLKLNFNSTNQEFYNFYQVGAHELDNLENSYDFLYCKAIEHIHDWSLLFEQAYKNSSSDALFYLKHKSFFSYLGAHRYALTGLPWGHLRMKDMIYDNYIDKIFPERSTNIKDFYYKGLAYPRVTIGNMIKIASQNGWKLGAVEYERSKHVDSFQNILFRNNSVIYDEIKINYDVSVEELLSGLIHITFTK